MFSGPRHWAALGLRSLRSFLANRAGLPEAGRTELLAARALALGSALFVLAIGVWEIAGPFGAGHYAASSAVTLAGENMLRFRTLLPLPDHPLGTPTSADAYCNHPFGIFWTSALFVAALGHHDFVCRLPAVLLSAATPLVCYSLARSLWGALPGALAAVAFASCPIVLCYANFNALEVPVMFGTLLAGLGYVRFRQTGRARFLWLTLGALAYSVNTDWAAYVFAACLLLLVFARTFIWGRGLSSDEFRRLATLFAFATLVVFSVALCYVLLLLHLEKLDDLLLQGLARSRGAGSSITEVLNKRSYWTELLFTPQAVWVGKLSALVVLLRVALKRLDLEAIPLAFLAMALFQYLVFEQGAEVHAFWPHYFAAFFALGLGAFGQSLLELARSSAVANRLQSARMRRSLPALCVGACFAIPVSMTRDALAALSYARKSGGRFNEKGAFIQPDKEKVAALGWLSVRAPEGAVIVLDNNMKRSLWVPWVLGRPTKVTFEPRLPVSDRYYVIDGRFADPTSLRDFSKFSAVSVVGPFWIFDVAGRAQVQGFSVKRREPTLLERAFVSSTHALRSVEPDPFWTWELRDFLGQRPNPAPTVPPQSFEQVRVSHNIALASGDAARAHALKSRLLAGADPKPATAHPDGTRLIGMRFEQGASDVLTLYFESSGGNQARFAVSARVEEPLPGSFVKPDPLTWNVGLPSAIPRTAWKRGYIYSSVTELIRRPGKERFYGYWVRPPPLDAAPAPGSHEEVTLLVLP